MGLHVLGLGGFTGEGETELSDEHVESLFLVIRKSVVLNPVKPSEQLLFVLWRLEIYRMNFKLVQVV